jgi:hypothetical protein
MNLENFNHAYIYTPRQKWTATQYFFSKLLGVFKDENTFFLVVFEADSEIKLLVGKMKITGTS